MADALLSPTIGVSFMAASGAGIGYAAKKLREQADDAKIPLMGVMGAFVFAAQMINFTIPGTGSSGHLGGGMLLAIVLGPYAAFIVISSVLIVQALFFADGGLLALGANIWNLAFYPCVVGWLIYQAIAGKRQSRLAMRVGAFAAALVAVELGALSVVFQTAASGKVDLPVAQFTALMLFIHLLIGLVEGAITVAVADLLFKIRPGMSSNGANVVATSRGLIVGVFVSAIIIAGGLSWFASKHPDGLEWSLEKIGWIDTKSTQTPATTLYPGYETKSGKGGSAKPGVAGSLIVLALAGGVGATLFKLRKSRTRISSGQGGD